LRKWHGNSISLKPNNCTETDVSQYDEITQNSRNCEINGTSMATVDEIRSGLIDKILTIKNKDFLMVLDNLVSSNSEDTVILPKIRTIG